MIVDSKWRQSHVHFTIGGQETDFTAMLDRVWDGMRPLPYTLRHLAMAIFGMYLTPPSPYGSSLDKEFITIEMGGMNGQYTRIRFLG